MKLIAPFTALLALCATTMASPMPNPEPVPEPVAELGTSPNLPALAKRAENWAECSFRDTGNFEFTIYTWGTWDDDWGQGFLDNLRGQCGQVRNWQFKYEGDRGTATFSLVTWIRAHCVEDAIWLASNPTGAIWNVNCSRN